VRDRKEEQKNGRMENKKGVKRKERPEETRKIKETKEATEKEGNKDNYTDFPIRLPAKEKKCVLMDEE
jgi:hypothetical protein